MSTANAPSVASRPLITVVIPIRNERRSIDACLASIVGQQLDGAEVEVIVVDGCSTDGTRERVLSWTTRYPTVRLLDNPRQIAPTALNIAIRAAQGRWIARMDGHSEAPPDYLARGLEDLRETGAWAVGGAMRRITTSAKTDAIAAATMSPFGVGNAAHNYSTKRMWAETVFLGMWPSWVFQRVGLFDEELVRNQDDEFSYRIREAGGRILLDPAISMAYQPRSSYSALFDQYRQYAMWKIRVFQMHPKSLRPRHWVPMIWVGWLSLATMGAILFPPALVLLVLGIGAYLAVMTVAALRIRRDLVDALRVVMAFITLHLGYGIGSWQGLIRFAPRWIFGRRGSPPVLDQPGEATIEASVH